MKHGSLFSGIGGFSLAGTWAGFSPALACEIDEFCRKVYVKHFPGVPIHEDIRSLDYETIKKKIGNNPITLVCGGFPCQPFSVAGRRKGTKDHRSLWSQMHRIINITKPNWVVAENVPGLLSSGGGLDFETVCSSLEDIGYTLQPLLLPAAGAGAPHVRERIFLVGNSYGQRENDCREKRQKGMAEKNEGRDSSGEADKIHDGRRRWDNQPGMDRISYGVPRRMDRLRALGNSVVPHVAYQVLRIIAEMERRQNYVD